MKNLKLIIITILFLVGSNLFGQRCKYEKDKIDPVTKLHIKRTHYTELTRVNSHPLYIKAQCIGTQKYLKIRYYKNSDNSIDENEPLKIIFIDNSFVLLNALPIGTNSSLSTSITTISSLLIYKLTKNQYGLLMDNPTKQIEYKTINGETLIRKIRKKYQNRLQNLMSCILLDTDK